MLAGSGNIRRSGDDAESRRTSEWRATLTAERNEYRPANHPHAPRRGRPAVYAPVVTDATENVSLTDAYAYCQTVTREIARTFYYGSLFLRPEKRLPTWALYAFCRTADDIADERDRYSNPADELARWRQALLDTYAGMPRGPVMTAWADVLRRYPVPLGPALDLLDGVTMDILDTRYDTFEELRLYCYRVAGTAGLLMAPVLGYHSDEALTSAVDLGIAMQLTNILRDIGEDAAVGRVYLPAEDLARFGYSQEELRAGLVNRAFVALMEFEINRAEEYYRSGMRGVSLLHADARLAIGLSAALYRAILHRIRRNQYDVFRRRAHISLPGKLAAIPSVWLRTQLAGLAQSAPGTTTFPR